MEILFVILGICFLFEIGYHICAILLYPIYTALGVRKNLTSISKTCNTDGTFKRQLMWLKNNK